MRLRSALVVLAAGLTLPAATVMPAQAAVVQCPATPAYTGFFNWYDHASPGMAQDNVHILNPGTAPVAGCVSMPGAAPLGFNLAPGQEGYVSFPRGTIGGPVTVQASARVIASQRVQYVQSFNEVLASTAADAAMTSYFNWYDHASPGMFQDNIHLLNPGSTTSSGTVTVAGAGSKPFAISAGGETYITFPEGTIGGPVTVAVTAGPAVIASQRVTYYQSFSEIRARTAAMAVGGFFSWYDHASPGMAQDNIHLFNPGLTTTSGTVSIHNGPSVAYSVPAGQETYVNFPQTTLPWGPVTVAVNAGPGVIASQRVQYYQSFSEVWASTGSDEGTKLFFNWYDLASPGMSQDNLHLVNAASPTVCSHVQCLASGTITLPGASPIGFSVYPGEEQHYSFPRGTIGGPVTVTIQPGQAGVLVSQRVTYNQSFTEVPASP